MIFLAEESLPIVGSGKIIRTHHLLVADLSIRIENTPYFGRLRLMLLCLTLYKTHVPANHGTHYGTPECQGRLCLLPSVVADEDLAI